jgi:hypothetical protein
VVMVQALPLETAPIVYPLVVEKLHTPRPSAEQWPRLLPICQSRFHLRVIALIQSSGVGKDMRATTASKDRGNAATPLSEMEHPVLEVLEGIRVQRMSLVQSLRQFVFVHRGQSFSLFTLDSTDADK